MNDPVIRSIFGHSPRQDPAVQIFLAGRMSLIGTGRRVYVATAIVEMVYDARVRRLPVAIARWRACRLDSGL